MSKEKHKEDEKHNHKHKHKSEHKKTHKLPEFDDVKEMSKDEIIKTLRNELEKKDKIIEKLNEEKEILFKVSIKNAKRRLEEEEDVLGDDE